MTDHYKVTQGQVPALTPKVLDFRLANKLEFLCFYIYPIPLKMLQFSLTVPCQPLPNPKTWDPILLSDIKGWLPTRRFSQAKVNSSTWPSLEMTSISPTSFILIVYLSLWARGQETFSTKNQIINIWGFVDHVVSVTATQFLSYSLKKGATIMSINEQGHVIIKLYLQKQVQGQH